MDGETYTNLFEKYNLGQYNFISIPIKSQTKKISVYNVDVHDVPAGTSNGIINIINHFAAMSNMLNDTKFHCFILDYDLYWKYYRIILATNLWSSMKQRGFVCLGNWHIILEMRFGNTSHHIYSPKYIIIRLVQDPCPHHHSLTNLRSIYGLFRERTTYC